jgi:hypothetical protein
MDLYFRGLPSTANWSSYKWSTVQASAIDSGTLPPPGPSDVAIFDIRSGIAGTPLEVPAGSNVIIGGLNLVAATTFNSGVLSLKDNMQINGDLNTTTNSPGNTILGNGFTISVGGNMNIGSNLIGLNNGLNSTGTLTLKVNGTGLQTLRSSGGYCQLKGVNATDKRFILEIDKLSGIFSISFNSGLYLLNAEFKYVSGVIPLTGGLLTADNSILNCGPNIRFGRLALKNTVSIETTDTNTELLDIDQLISSSNATLTSTSNKGINVYSNYAASAVSNTGFLTTTSAAPSFIKFVGTADSTILFGNASSIYQYIGANIIFNKTAPAKVTLPPTMYFGSQNYNASWTHTSGTVDGSACTLHIRSNAPNITFNTNNFNTVLNKLVIDKLSGSGLDHNITINSPLKFQGALEIQNVPVGLVSNTTFLGTSGFDVTSFTATSSTITLKAGNTYKITDGVFTLTGNPAARTVLKSDTSTTPANGSITATVSPTLSTLTFTSATSLVGYRVSQAFNNAALLRRLPAGLIFPPMDISTSDFLAQVTGGSVSTWTLNKTSLAGVPLRGLMLGLPAFLEVTNCTYDINLVTTFDIDSSGGDKVLANNSYQNKQGIPNPNLWRTVNWDSTIPLLPLVSAAYVE